MHADDVGVTQIIEEDQPTPIEPTSEEEDNPGELVSVWYAMKKQYEHTLQALLEAATKLNEIGDTLRSAHGIEVPRVSHGAQAASTPQAILEPEIETQPQPDSGWTPPYQQPVVIEPAQTSVRFIEELRNDASLGENEKGFADHIGKIFSNLQGFGR